MILIVGFSSCSKMLNLNLSKSEIKSLDTIYYQKKNFKVFDTEWVFLDKNICLYKTTLLRKKTYIGTWTKIGDSIKMNFFYERRNAPADRMVAIDNLEFKQNRTE